MTTNVLQLPGNYRIKVINGIVTVQTGQTFFTGDIDVAQNAEIHTDTILGDSASNTIKANATFISDVNPYESNLQTYQKEVFKRKSTAKDARGLD